MIRLLILTAMVLNIDSTPTGTLDTCHTDTECATAARRHCERGDTFYCKGEI